LRDPIDNESLHLTFVALLPHLVFGYIIPTGVKSKPSNPWTTERQELIIPHIPPFVVDSDDRITIDAFDDHFDSSDTPDVIGVSNIDIISNFDLFNLLFKLPGDEIALLGLPLDLDVGILGVGDELADHIVDAEAAEQHAALRRADCFVAHETSLFHYQVLVNTLCAKAVTANCSLAFVDEFEAQRANQSLEVLGLIDGDLQVWM
jgi:hypothetical protein